MKRNACVSSSIIIILNSNSTNLLVHPMVSSIAQVFARTMEFVWYAFCSLRPPSDFCQNHGLQPCLWFAEEVLPGGRDVFHDFQWRLVSVYFTSEAMEAMEDAEKKCQEPCLWASSLDAYGERIQHNCFGHTDNRPSTLLVPFKLLLLSCATTLFTLASKKHRRPKKDIAESCILSLRDTWVGGFVVLLFLLLVSTMSMSQLLNFCGSRAIVLGTRIGFRNKTIWKLEIAKLYNFRGCC